MRDLNFAAIVVCAALTVTLSVATPPPASASTCPTGFSLVAGTTNVCERRFTSTGTTTWTVPSGITSIDVMVVGGGGGGGGGRSTTNYSGGGGGGGGGIVATSGLAVTSSQSFTVTVGVGGTYGSSGDDGQGGGLSSFTRSSPALTISATGGNGGTKGSTGNGPGGSSVSGSCTGCTSSAIPSSGAGGTGSSGVGANGSNGVTVISSFSSVYGLLREGSTSIAVGGGGGGGGGSTSSTGGSGGGGTGGGLIDSVAGTAHTGGGGGGGGSFNSSQSKSGAPGGSGVVIIRTLASDPAPTPTFGAPVRTAGGFTVNVTNYDAAFTWSPSVSAGSVSAGSASGSTLPLTVTGLSAGASSTVTVTTSRTGYSNASATVSGQAKSTQSVTWSPSTAVTTVQSPLTPSTSAAALGSAPISYAVVAGFTTSTCAVDASSGQLAYTGTGTCTVRATAATTSDYLEGTKDVTFTVSKATQSVTWSPITAVTTVQSPLTPSTSASALGGAPITYAKVSNTTTTCGVDATTGQLTYTGTGNCVVRATAAATDLYASGTTDVTFTISKATPSLTWNPTLSLEVPSGSTTFTAATTSSDGALTYTVTNAGTTGCSLPTSTSRVLSFTAEGSCEVTASVAASDTYNAVTSVKTFAISKATQNVTWAPSSTLTLATLSATLATATTSGDGAITYSVTSAGGTGCAFATASSPVLTYATAGTCTVTATAASTTGYAQGTQSASITITLATPTMTWTPSTALTMPATTVNPTAATTTGDGAITYAVTSGSHCSVDTNTGALTYTATGNCQITATSAATPRYTSGSTAVTFTISLASQTITASASSTSLRPLGTATLTTSGTSGTGALTWTSADTGICTISVTTVTALTNGSCVLTASIAADTTYAAASATITITITTPGGGGGGGGGGSGGGSGGSGGGGDAPSGNGGATAATSTTNSAPGAVASTDQVVVPGSGVAIRGRALPPPPEDVTVVRGRAGTRSTVVITQPARASGVSVLSTVVVIRDATGRVISRINIAVKPQSEQAEVTVPYIAEGYTVNVYNVNEVGVSPGALTQSPLIRATTITQRGKNRQPSLFGTLLGKPIIFTGDSAALSTQAREQLDLIAQSANTRNERLFITGFARTGGGTKDELASLSTRRARAAAQYLADRGVRVWIRYWGAGTLNGTGKDIDRRVEIRTSTAPIPRTLVQ